MATGHPLIRDDGTPLLMPSGSPAVDSGSGCVCCATGGEACTNCSGGGRTPLLYRATITGSGGCGCVNFAAFKWEEIRAGFDGDYDITQFASDPCEYRTTFNDVATQDYYLGESGGCNEEDLNNTYSIKMYFRIIIGVGTVRFIMGFQGPMGQDPLGLGQGILDETVSIDCETDQDFDVPCELLNTVAASFGGFNVNFVPVF